MTGRSGNDLDCPGGPNAHRRALPRAEAGRRSGGQQVAVEAPDSGGWAQAALQAVADRARSPAHTLTSGRGRRGGWLTVHFGPPGL